MTTEQTLTTADGRTVAYTVDGPADGAVVVLLHSAPGSRHLDPDPAATAAAGVRLVTIDRPGYGGSSPFPSDVVPSLPAQADDVAAVLDALGAAEAGIAGWSHGGRVAAAFAARHPERIRALAIVGTPSPEDLTWIPEEQQALLDGLRDDPFTATAKLAAILEEAGQEAPEGEAGLAYIAGPGDADLLTDDAVKARVVAMVESAFARGAVGCAADVVADQLAPWGFDPRSIGAPTSLVYSEDDFVAPYHGDWWADRISTATRTTTSGVGHLLIVPEWAAVLAHLA